MNADSLRERTRLAHAGGRNPRSSHRLRTHLPTMLAFAFVAFAGCGAGVTDALSGTAGMYVQTEDELASSGLVGGPFLPASIDYDISNVGTIPMTWSVSSDQPWVDITPANGVLDSLQSESVALTFGASAAQLQPGSYTANVSFVNQTDNVGNTSRQVTLTVTAPGSQPMTTATRTSGPAPLAVMFDPIGSTSGVVQPAGAQPDHASFTYEWNYGSPSSGTWQYTGKPKNVSFGWLGAHVYETPGTYRVTLKVTNTQGTSFDYHQDITVTDPDTVFASRTYYVASNGNDGGPGTQSQPFRTPARAIQQIQGRGGPARIRIRRGDSFTCTSNLEVGNSPHQVMIDAYGTGNRPVLTFTGSDTGVEGQGAHTIVSNLDMRQQSTTAPTWSRGIYSFVPVTAYQTRMQGFGYAVRIASSNSVFAECEILDCGAYGMFISDSAPGMELVAVLGSRLDNAIDEHLIRSYVSKGMFHANLFQRVNGTKHAIKMVGAEPPHVFQHNLVSDNLFETACNWVVSIGPQNTTSDEHVRDTLISGNTFRSGPGNVPLVLNDRRITIVNNVFDVEDTMCINIFQRGIGPMPDGIRIEHNTAYQHIGDPFRFVTASTSDQTVVRHNIAYARQGTTQISGSVNATNNLLADPMFVDAVNDDFRLSPGSPAIDAATGSPLRIDFSGASRPVGAQPDQGALERR